MDIESVFGDGFRIYGQILKGFDFKDLVEAMAQTPCPGEGFVYKPSEPMLEKLSIFREIQNRIYGGMPIQMGYCNGNNRKLNCLEYHRGSEISIAVDDIIVLVGLQTELENYSYCTEKVKAFRVPAGTGIELYATTLHYAPCGATSASGFRVVNVLPKGTNEDIPDGLTDQGEDRMCMGRNKWLIAHQTAPEAQNGAFIGLIGENIEL